MSHHEELPGVTPAGGPDPTLEWVRPTVGVIGTLSARLGSDPRAEELLLTVMRALRGQLPRDSWDGIVDELAFTTRAALRSDEATGTAAPVGADPITAVATTMMHPRARTRLEVAAVFASLKATLPRGLVDAVSTELRGELADVWRTAR